MNKVEAVTALVKESHSEKTTQTAINRSLNACKALGLNRAETIGVLMYLGFCNHEGKPWRKGFTLKLPK